MLGKEHHSGFGDQPSEDEFHRLKKDNDLYKHLVENSLGLICAHDPSGRLLSVNAEAARSLDYAQDDLVGRNISELLDPAVRDLFRRYLRQVATHGEVQGELRLMKRGGEVVTWSYRTSLYEHSDSAPIIIGHAIDITWRLQLETKLKESRAQYQALFEEAPVAYHEINREGLMVRVNKAECKLLGWNKDELLGRPVWDFISSGQKATSEAQVKRKLSGVQLLVPFLREYVRKDGEKLTFLIHENLIRSTSGEIIGIRSTLLDVTEQNRAEAELRQMNADLDARISERTAELEDSNRRLNEFVHMVSHDLREPLRSVSAFTSLLRQRYGRTLDDEAVSLLDHVVSSAARMTMLIQDLLSYSRSSGSDIQLTRVDLSTVVDAALANLREAVERNGARISKRNLPVVNADFTQMMQLFQNLVDNALKYRSESLPEISITGRQEGSTALISISDNGIGIPEGERERVFGLFKRASKDDNGSGMGLAICQAIVERHNGRIWIEAGSGTGSTFSFTIPNQQN